MRNPAKLLRNTCLICALWVLPLLVAGGTLHARASWQCLLPELAGNESQDAPNRQPHLLGVLLTLVQTTNSNGPLSATVAASGADLSSAAMNLGLVLLAVVVLLVTGVTILVYGLVKGKIRIQSSNRDI
ncbi:MAG: hypothetical protein KF690_05840 [Bacteroidetes bacterium]|nr:hypothetical protein [Bacteroidota bacterium]